MNNLNERLMDSIHQTYRVTHRNMAQGILAELGGELIMEEEVSPRKPLRGNRMDRKELLRKKEQALALQREQIIREMEAIVRRRRDEGSENAEQVSEGKLAKYLNTHPQNLSDALEKLEREGYIKRTKRLFDRNDGTVSLTGKGHSRAAELAEIKARKNAEFLKPLTEEEKATLLTLLDKLNITEELGLE